MAAKHKAQAFSLKSLDTTGLEIVKVLWNDCYWKTPVNRLVNICGVDLQVSDIFISLDINLYEHFHG